MSAVPKGRGSGLKNGADIRAPISHDECAPVSPMRPPCKGTHDQAVGDQLCFPCKAMLPLGRGHGSGRRSGQKPRRSAT